MSFYSQGLYVFTVYAAASGSSGATVRANALKKYSKEDIESLGKLVTKINFGTLQDKFRDAIDDGASKLDANISQIRGIILEISGEYPSVAASIIPALKDTGKDIVETAEKVGSGIFTGLKMLTVIAVIGGVVYVAYQAGVLKKLVPSGSK